MKSCVEDGKYILTVSELHQLYSDHLHDFGMNNNNNTRIEKEVNRTRLKLRILSQFAGKFRNNLMERTSFSFSIEEWSAF